MAVRNIRRDAMAHVNELMNEKMIGEDDERRAEHQVDELTEAVRERSRRIGKPKSRRFWRSERSAAIASLLKANSWITS